MNDSWFDEYLFEIAARKSYLPAALRAALEEEPIVLPAWDPMGSLAHDPMSPPPATASAEGPSYAPVPRLRRRRGHVTRPFPLGEGEGKGLLPMLSYHAVSAEGA